MGVIQDVRSEREDLARVLKKHTGIRRIVEDLYPDSAHFIYELLQNAEDTGATSASFKLTHKSLVFEHNGRAFSREDMLAITDIGEGTKAGDDDKIGRFGVGFKAVFAYSETPRIWSPTFSFMIADLVLPSQIDPCQGLGQNTRFEFPFNNPKKISEIAFAEVSAGLTQIAETTLLFLTSLESISWSVEDEASGEVLRIKHADQHFENLKQIGGKTTTSTHFLKFDQPVLGLEKQMLSVAFALDFLPKVECFDSKKPIAKQLKIVPAMPGYVAVFFPAEKETSGLRFHLHAPFVPELSRASIKETSTNDPLFVQLASLAAASLHQIRDLGLLTAEFLSVLPNPQDAIPARYAAIRKAIIHEMNTQPLTPTQSRSHAPACRLLQGKAALKELLSEEDIEFLVDYEEEPPLWAAAAQQKSSNADRFMTGLAIQTWDIEQFTELLSEKTDTQYDEPDENFMVWLAAKSVDWHQQFYALLYRELEPIGAIDMLNQLNIVRLVDGDYGIGSECFFSGDSDKKDNDLLRVNASVFSSGKSKQQQESARKLLEAIGVREVGEAEEVELILKKRYSSGAISPRKHDLKRFIKLFESDPSKAALFREYYIFELQDEDWGRPEIVYLDRPFIETGLSAWYDMQGKAANKYALSDKYKDCGVKSEAFAKFAIALGAQTRLNFNKVCCSGNNRWLYLHSVSGDRHTSPINNDYQISGIEKALSNLTLPIAKLFWNTMINIPGYVLKARYQKNLSNGSHFADSQLVCSLQSASWVPQGEGVFVRPAEALREHLPEGFAFDAGWPWLKAINFGQDATQRSEEHRHKREIAKQLGFDNVESLERARRFSGLPADEQVRILTDMERRQSVELPDNEITNPELRAQRIGMQAAEAPERQSEERVRSISLGISSVKEEAAQYLRQLYTNSEGEVICQVCKDVLPFKLADGSYYFEKVQFLAELKKHHYQNYLALCPNHSAMFRHANGTAELLCEMFIELNGNQLELVLADKDESIYFNAKHIGDLKKVIDMDRSA